MTSTSPRTPHEPSAHGAPNTQEQCSALGDGSGTGRAETPEAPQLSALLGGNATLSDHPETWCDLSTETLCLLPTTQAGHTWGELKHPFASKALGGPSEGGTG